VRAHAFLVAAAVTSTPATHTGRAGPLTCNKVGHRYATLAAWPATDPGPRLRWSAWRRHQARARTYRTADRQLGSVTNHELWLDHWRVTGRFIVDPLGRKDSATVWWSRRSTSLVAYRPGVSPTMRLKCRVRWAWS
jgi:hypothetical protein